MEQRTRNRLKEHSEGEHKLTLNEKNTNNPSIKTSQTAWVCSCGWQGWLTIPVNFFDTITKK